MQYVYNKHFPTNQIQIHQARREIFYCIKWLKSKFFFKFFAALFFPSQTILEAATGGVL